jgi:hypothetical protein
MQRDGLNTPILLQIDTMDKLSGLSRVTCAQVAESRRDPIATEAIESYQLAQPYLTRRTIQSTIRDVPYPSSPGSREPENVRLAQAHGLTVKGYGNRIRTHSPEASGSPPSSGQANPFPAI